MIAMCMRVISSHDMPRRYALTYDGYSFAVSSPVERAWLTNADRRHARSSAAVMGRRSVSVPGLGIGIRDMWCAGWGMILIASDVVMMYVSVLNQVSGRRAKMLIVNCR